MKASTAIGIVLALAGLLMGALMEGTAVGAFMNIPAILIVMGGTLGVTMASFDMDDMKKLPALYKAAMSPEPLDRTGRLAMLVGFAEKARREGLLALDDDVNAVEDEFTRKGLQLVVDGTDPDHIRDILENEIDGMAGRHAHHASIFEKAGGFAPTMGIIGTVMGLVHVLENLDAPETLGPAISGAFIATLIGVGAANVVLLPVSNKLKALSHAEQEFRYMTLEGVLAIQAGDNPRVVSDKLMSFIPPAERSKPAEAGGAAPGAGGTQATPEPVGAAL